MYDEKNESKLDLTPEAVHSQENTKLSNNNSDSSSEDLVKEILCISIVFGPIIIFVVSIPSILICRSCCSDKSNDKKPLLSKSNQNYNEVVNDTTATIDDYNNLLNLIHKLKSTTNQDEIQLNQIPNHLNHYLNSDEYNTINYNIDNSTYNPIFIINSKITN